MLYGSVELVGANAGYKLKSTMLFEALTRLPERIQSRVRESRAELSLTVLTSEKYE